MCHKLENKLPKIFQTSFHDRIIHDEKDHQKTWEYIDANAIKRKFDCFYKEGSPM